MSLIDKILNNRKEADDFLSKVTAKDIRETRKGYPVVMASLERLATAAIMMNVGSKQNMKVEVTFTHVPGAHGSEAGSVLFEAEIKIADKTFQA